MTSRRAFWPAIFALLAFISAAAVNNFTTAGFEIEEIVVASRSGRPIRAVVYVPVFGEAPQSRSKPAVVAIPPYSIPPEAMDIICSELAERGTACAIPDFFGKTSAESRQRMGDDSLQIMTLDVLSIIELLRGLPFVDPKRIGVCGHSVGGTVAVLAGESDPGIRATVPIGMESDFGKILPRNLLFLSGFYDEIHSPTALVQNLADNRVTEFPEEGVIYGSPRDGNARMVKIIPTTDHFIETFDPFLIRELLDWYALALSEPALREGRLDSWYRKIAVFLLAFALAALWAVAAGRLAASIADRQNSRIPAWLLIRLQALPLVAAVAVLWAIGERVASARLVCVYLMAALIVSQELASYRARGVIRHGDRSPFRLMRSAGMIMLALGAATLVSFAVVCAPYFAKWPEALAWFPVFCANMALLFPLEVWGRSMPSLFSETIGGVEPGRIYFTLLALAALFPSQLARGFDRLAQEMVIAVRARLRPLDPPVFKENKDKVVLVTPVKVGLLAVLLIVLGFLVYRRIDEGMLTPETAYLAGISILRYAALPFVIAALIVRTRAFRRLALLD